MKQYAKAHLTLMMTALVASVSFGGCSKPPATTTQDVVDYVRNAEEGAAVRRLDTKAQAYVEHVMGAYGAYDKACKPVADLASRKALWPLDDAKWRDLDKVTKLRDDLEKWTEDAPDPSEPSAKTRPQLLSELSEAIMDIPSLPDSNTNTESRMIADIKSRLDTDDKTSKYAQVAPAYLELLIAAIDHAEDFDPNATGLAFNSATLTTRVTSAWKDLHDMVEKPLDEELAEMTDRIAGEEVLRATALKEKQSLRSEITTDSDKLGRHRELGLLVEYYDARIKFAERRKKKLEQEASAGSQTEEKPAAAHP